MTAIISMGRYSGYCRFSKVDLQMNEIEQKWLEKISLQFRVNITCHFARCTH